MIKVIYTVDNFIQASLGGGLLRHMSYARGLRERGIQIEWLTMESDADSAFEERWCIRVQVVPMDPTLPVQKKRELLLKEAFREAAKLPPGQRVVSTDSCGMTWNTTAQVWQARLQGIPSMHNTSIMPGPMPRHWLRIAMVKVVYRAFIQGLSLLIPQTEGIGRFFREYFRIPATKLRVIGNGVDCSHYQPATEEQKREARLKLGLPEGVPVVLSVGSVVPRKGMHLLLQAWPEVLRQYPAAKLLIAGTLGRRATFVDKAASLDDYTQQIHDLIQGLPDPASVVLSGKHVEDVLEYYQAADVFAFASEREGLPNAVIEAMACGLPSVIATYDGIPLNGEEFGDRGIHFLECDRTSPTLAQGLLQTLNDAPLREAMGQAARQRMVSSQDLPKTIDQWAAMYREVASGIQHLM